LYNQIDMRPYAIILALDLPSADEVLSCAKDVGDMMDGIKIGVTTLLESGVSLLGRLKDCMGEKPLLVDLKIADIGFISGGAWSGTNAKIIGRLKDTGATHVTVHGFPGPVSIAETVEAGKQVGIDVLLLPMMSHSAAELFFSRKVSSVEIERAAQQAGIDAHFKSEFKVSDITEAILVLGEALGVNGYIGPATRPDDLKRYRSITKKPIWCPGFGRQDRLKRPLEEQFRDWARIVGPNSAAIVGSEIYKAKDKKKAAQQIVDLRNKVVPVI
jgi:orotidine-5'-phosphate decarboxylase